jgi:hypothetical protein
MEALWAAIDQPYDELSPLEKIEQIVAKADAFIAMLQKSQERQTLDSRHRCEAGVARTK